MGHRDVVGLGRQRLHQLVIAHYRDQPRCRMAKSQRPVVEPGAASQSRTAPIDCQRGYEDCSDGAQGGRRQPWAVWLAQPVRCIDEVIGAIIAPLQRLGVVVRANPSDWDEHTCTYG